MNLILKYFKEKRRLFLSWLFSYVIIIIISLLISSIAYVQSVKVIKAEINKSHFAMLKQLQQTVDTKLNDIERIMNTIVIDNNVIEQSYSDYTNPMDPTSMLNVIRTIKACELTNSYINDIFIYYPNRHMVVSSNGTCGDKEYFQIYFPNRIKDQGEWINFLGQRHDKEFCPMSSLNPSRPDLGGIVFMQAISYNKHKKNYSTLGIILNSSFLEKSLSSFNGILEGNSIIINDKNELVAALKKQYGYKISDFNFKDDQGIKSFTLTNSKVELVHIKSDIVNWIYINIIPRSLFVKKAKDVIDVMLLCVLLCLCGGVIAALIFSRKNYNPIDNIIQFFLETGKLEFDSKMSEFKMIENCMQNIVDENKNMIQTLEKQKLDLKNNFLNRLVKGYIKDNISLDDIFCTYGIEFKGESYVLILFYLEQVGKIYSLTDKENEENSLELAQFILGNVMEEVINKENYCFHFEVDQAIAFLVNPAKSCDKNEEILDNINKNIVNSKKMIMDKYSILFTASVSNVHPTLHGISTAYRECIEAAEYRLVIGTNNIILYKEILVFGSTNSTNLYSIEVQQQFINSIRAGDFVNARQILEQIFEQNFVNSNISLDMARCLMFAIINTMVNAINDIYMVVGREFFENLNPVQKLIQCKTVYEMKKHMEDILREIEIYNDTKKRGTSSSQIKNIIEYIEDHYFDHNLSVSSIAVEFNLNPVYLSRFFKEQTGRGLLNTINGIRLTKAKILLKEDLDLNVKNISEMAGFLNSTDFIRTFKKYEGITPGKYRELSEIENS